MAKQEIYIIAGSVLFVLSFVFLSVNFSGFTGYAIVDSGNATNIENATREDALNAINQSPQIIQEMKENNFSTAYMDDKLIEAGNILKQVDYTEILRNNSADYSKRREAQNALNLINWQELTYNDILVYTDEIQERKKQAFEIFDSLIVSEKNLEKYKNNGVDLQNAEEILINARESFYADRYSEAEVFLKEAKAEMDSKTAESSLVGGLKRGTLNFFQLYWYYILIFLILLTILIYFSNKKITRLFLKNKIERLKAERTALNELIKETQEERFEENEISGLTYNIRIKKYKEKLDNISEELPVIEARLKRFK